MENRWEDDPHPIYEIAFQNRRLAFFHPGIGAPYRETANKIAKRKAEGCLSVEMESAGLMAVAQFRKVILGQIFYIAATI